MSGRRKKKSSGHQSIFDKLTDHNLYTGAHKSRFNADGTGRGQAGRDLGSVGRGSQNSWHGERFKSSGGSGGVEKMKKSPSGGTVKRKKKSSGKKSTKKQSIFDKLTDHTQYTGSHKNRFNADGTGRGQAGRDLGKMGSGSLGGSWHGERFNDGEPLSGPSTSSSSGGMKKSSSGVKKKKVVKKKTSASGTKTKKKSSGKKKKQSIFDKLTDHSQYTGSHKNRFNADGSGRGQAGRDLGKMGGGSIGGSPW